MHRVKTAIKLRVYGKVQGVWFRASTQSKARELALKGSVQNNSDGSVLIYAYGSSERVEQLKKWCEAGGPPHARVEQVIVEDIEWQELQDFIIIRSNSRS